jgi:hypothetical protein
MADENQNSGTQIPNEPSPIEQRAMEQGWVPLDEWTGDADDWRPAKEFVDRGELLKSISSLKRDNIQLKQAFDEFGRHHAKVREIEYQRAINDLKAQKRDALVEGDADAVIKIDDKLDELKEAAKAAEKDVRPAVNEPAEPHPAFVAWEQRNGWYRSDRAMKNTADEIAKELVLSGERDPLKILKEIDSQIRKEFPNKFTNPNREKAGSVEGANQKGGRVKEDFLDSMSDDERRIMKRIIATGAITKEKYLEEFKARKSA